MISLALPWAAVLAVPAAVAWWRFARHGAGRWWRAALLVMLVLAATRPQLIRDDGGSDVLLVLDRSASMVEARRGQDELVRLAGAGRQRGDRLGVIVAGASAAVAQGPQTTGLPRLDDHHVDEQGSDLAAALDTAAALVAPGRSVRVVLVSDGEATGADPRRAATRLALLNARLDVLPAAHPPGADAAIVEIDVPGSLRQGESFLGSVLFTGDRPEQRSWRVLRDNAVIATGTVALRPGKPSAVAFTDRPAAPGLAAYIVELDASNDRQPANNRARAWLRVAGGERVLVVGGDGSPGNVGAAISAAGLAVSYRAAGPLQLGDLLGVQAVVIDDVPAGAIGRGGMLAIARWVQHLGGGLVMTGGRQSFGLGGWHRSPVEPILPVSLEVRDEHRVLSVAMAIAVDRSGSMAATIPDGRQKIELAAEGAAAAIELLGPRDRIAVLAVDTAPHEVLAMTRVEDPKRLAREVIGMQSAGGGIYVYTALAAAGRELLQCDAGTRHLLLFADAADAEEPGDYINLLAEFRKQGITVSVVGMGSDRDKDAAFLADVAKRGGGRIAFAEDPADLPRLFAQETVLVARNPWIDQRVAPQPRSGALQALFGTADSPLLATWPSIPGYNLSYPRPRAEVLAWCPGDPTAPALAAWTIGTGRSVALPIPCAAADTSELIAWPGYSALIAEPVRWAAGAAGSAPAAIQVRRHGSSVELRVELDPERPSPPPELMLVDVDAQTAPVAVPLVPLDADTWTVEIPLKQDRPLIPAVRLGTSTLLGPALALPMPAEAAPRRDLPPGDAVLRELAQMTGGTTRGDVLGIWDNPASRGVARELAPWLVMGAIGVLLGEIAVRRLRIKLPELPALRWKRRTATRKTPVKLEMPMPTAPAEQSGVLDALDEIKRRR